MSFQQRKVAFLGRTEAGRSSIINALLYYDQHHHQSQTDKEEMKRSLVFQAYVEKYPSSSFRMERTLGYLLPCKINRHSFTTKVPIRLCHGSSSCYKLTLHLYTKVEMSNSYEKAVRNLEKTEDGYYCHDCNDKMEDEVFQDSPPLFDATRFVDGNETIAIPIPATLETGRLSVLHLLCCLRMTLIRNHPFSKNWFILCRTSLLLPLCHQHTR